jgi:hypothetical protein
MRKLICRLRLEWHNAMFAVSAPDDFEAEEWHCPPYPVRVIQAGYMVLAEPLVHWLAREIICRFRGHDYEHDGWAGPESGGESWCCRRCGHGGRVIYY